MKTAIAACVLPYAKLGFFFSLLDILLPSIKINIPDIIVGIPHAHNNFKKKKKKKIIKK